MSVKITDPNELWHRIDRRMLSPGGCWDWQGYVHPRDGYGYLRWSCLSESRAHRAAYALANGPIPEGGLVLHLCDNRVCCNPSHLVLGDDALNTQHKLDRQRQSRLKGSVNARALLTEAQVATIKGRLFVEHNPSVKAGLLGRIAKEYGVSQPTISAIATGRNWSHVEPLLIY